MAFKLGVENHGIVLFTSVEDSMNHSDKYVKYKKMLISNEILRKHMDSNFKIFYSITCKIHTSKTKL